MWSVFFVFLSYLDRYFAKGEPMNFFLDAEKEGKVLFYMLDSTFCGKIVTIGQYSFSEVSDGVEKVHSVHDSEGNLVDCSMTTNDIHVKSFTHVCRLGLREQKSESTAPELKLTNVTEAKANCDKLKSKNAKSVAAQAQSPTAVQPNTDTASHSQTLRRAKRGFTYPGTLWCGAGNIADNYEQLGEFAETDKCCRTHDHCPNVIHAFSSKYGYTNFKWHSISHCDCDNTLKQCLREVNDTSSRVVGQAFFNVIEAPCFEFSFEEQCVERHWYGMCKRYDKVPVAVLRESIPYDFGGIEVIDALTVSPLKKKPAQAETVQGSETTSQPSLPGSTSTPPEEPSITNVVTAAEDFIKVLATVSTSQGSSADANRQDAQTADKKRKKTAGKKKKDSKKRREKGRGKKRKQSTDIVPTAEEGVIGAQPAERTEQFKSKNILVEDPGNFDQVSDNFMNSAFSCAGDRKNYNKIMMRDDYQRMADESQDSTTNTYPPSSPHHTSTPSTIAQTKPNTELLELPTQIKEPAPHSSAVHIHSIAASKPRRAGLRQKAERKRKRHPTPLPAEATVHNTLGDVSAEGVSKGTDLTTRSLIRSAGEEVSRSLEYQHEKGSSFTATTQNRPIVETKRPRLRQRGGRKRGRKFCTSTSLKGGEAPPSLTADALTVPTSNTTQELSVHHSREPQSSPECTQSSRLENLAERPQSSERPADTAGSIQLTKRLQRLKGASGRRCVLSRFHTSLRKVASKKKHEATMITVSRTRTKTNQAQPGVDFPSRLLTEEKEVRTGSFFPPTQRSTSSMSPFGMGTTKRRRSKGRDKKRRKTVTET